MESSGTDEGDVGHEQEMSEVMAVLINTPTAPAEGGSGRGGTRQPGRDGVQIENTDVMALCQRKKWNAC